MKNIIFKLNLFSISFCFGVGGNPKYTDEIESQWEKFVYPIGLIDFRTEAPTTTSAIDDRPSPLIGTLIDPLWCITAEHCAPLPKTKFSIGDQNYSVEKVVLHHLREKFPKDPRYDLALVKIARPIVNHPVTERERDDSSCSLNAWVISLKYKVSKEFDKNGTPMIVKTRRIATGVVELYNPQAEGVKYLSPYFYTCFYNTQENFDRGKYTFDQIQNAFDPDINNQIANLPVKPKLEKSRFRIFIEDGDSGSPVVRGVLPLTEPVWTCKLMGIVLGRIKSEEEPKKVKEENNIEDEEENKIETEAEKLARELKKQEDEFNKSDDELNLRTITSDGEPITEGHMGVILRLPNTGLNEEIDRIIAEN